MTEDFHKYIKIRPLGYEENEGIFTHDDDEIVIEEKIDGANFRFMLLDDETIIFGSRNRKLGKEEAEAGKSWARCVQYVKRQLDESKAKFKKYKGLIFYGECCTKHSLGYDWDKIPPYLGYDIYDIKTERFINYEEKKKIFTKLNLIMVPLIAIKKAGVIELPKEEDVPVSEYTLGNTQAEGIVYKNYKRQLFAKFVREKFKEIAKDTFGGNKKHAANDDERVCIMYSTNARIDKIIFKLLDDGEKLQMNLMHKLPVAVVKDIMEDHWEDVAFSQWTINFRNLKKMISRRCLAVLKQMITNNALHTGGSKNGDQ